jgi:hypothetical protein
VATPYPDWVMYIAVCIIAVGVLPIPAVFLLRRFQCLKFDTDIHQGAIRRIDTTASTREMMADVDVSTFKIVTANFHLIFNIIHSHQCSTHVHCCNSKQIARFVCVNKLHHCCYLYAGVTEIQLRVLIKIF